jgi:hypothetical protein
VNYVEYNCLAGAEAIAAPPLADCDECGVNIGRQAARIIGASKGVDGKTAYEIALEAARSADEDNVALASENEDDGTGGEVIETASTKEEATGDAEAARDYRERGARVRRRDYRSQEHLERYRSADRQRRRYER